MSQAAVVTSRGPGSGREGVAAAVLADSSAPRSAAGAGAHHHAAILWGWRLELETRNMLWLLIFIGTNHWPDGQKDQTCLRTKVEYTVQWILVLFLQSRSTKLLIGLINIL